MHLTFANSAFVAAPERVLLRGGQWSWLALRVRYGVLRHPRFGVILIDTGIGPAALTGPGRPLMMRAYAAALRYQLQPDHAPAVVLAALGVQPADVTTILLTHFHADHVARLAEFPRARIITHAPTLAAIRAAPLRRNLAHGIFPSLLPADLETRLTCFADLPRRALPFGGDGADVLGDGSCLAVDLPGHATGHVGLAFDHLPRPLLYGCDAQWLLAALAPGRAPRLPSRLILDNPAAAAISTRQLRAWQDAGGEVVLCHDPARTLHDWPDSAAQP